MLTSASATHRPPKSKSFLLLPLLAVCLSSCASVSVFQTEAKQFAGLPQRLPDKIWVQNFSTPSDRFDVDRSGRDLHDFEYNLAEMLNRHLVWRISDEIAPAAGAAVGAPLGKQNAWLVTGSFDRVEQGSRLLRFFPGFGVGGTSLQTTTKVYDLRDKSRGPFLTIRTIGGSNAMPAWLAPIEGLSRDNNRTARQITKAMQEYLFNQGLRTRKHTAFPKYSGSWP